MDPHLFERWPDLDRIFAEALDRAPEERLGFVRQECGGDQELEREILRLLEALENSGERGYLLNTSGPHMLWVWGDQRRSYRRERITRGTASSLMTSSQMRIVVRPSLSVCAGRMALCAHGVG
jgi:hypothetical protein